MSEEKRALAGCRVLDLMEHGSGLCARLLGDFGADVIKIEPPGGSRLRSIGPFYHDNPDPEKSLSWFAFNTGKKSITLNLESAQGQQILQKLVKSADFVVESFIPGYLGGLGLGYDALSQINPAIILTSITPFGQSGPYSQYKGSELVTEAMGGIVYNVGTPDRPPVRPIPCRSGSIPCLLAEVEAAGGSLLAHYHRLVNGEGQHVDVSVQECVSNEVANYHPIYWDATRTILKRPGGGLLRASRGVTIRRRAVYPCKDGWAQAFLHGEWFEPMVEWLDSAGMAGDLKTDLKKWEKRLRMDADPPLSQEEVNHIEDTLAAFLATRTKSQIYEEAEARGIGWGGINAISEVIGNEQLKGRSSFVEVDHPELGQALRYAMPPYKLTGTPPAFSCRAPLIGEHNQAIYTGELGFSPQELVFFKESGVV